MYKRVIGIMIIIMAAGVILFSVKEERNKAQTLFQITATGDERAEKSLIVRIVEEAEIEKIQGEISRYNPNYDEEFLYEAVLSDEEKEEMSTAVKLVGQVDVEDYAKYKEFLKFGGEAEWAPPEAYSYISDGANISLEQAMDLCMEILVLKGTEKEHIERIMEVDEDGMFVGYSFNRRNYQMYPDDNVIWIDNCIGVRADSIINDGMKMSFTVYERHRGESNDWYDHLAGTAQFLICLREKVIIFE